jgi:hypothetical protein
MKLPSILDDVVCSQKEKQPDAAGFSSSRIEFSFFAICFLVDGLDGTY